METTEYLYTADPQPKQRLRGSKAYAKNPFSIPAEVAERHFSCRGASRYPSSAVPEYYHTPLQPFRKTTLTGSAGQGSFSSAARQITTTSVPQVIRMTTTMATARLLFSPSPTYLPLSAIDQHRICQIAATRNPRISDYIRPEYRY